MSLDRQIIGGVRHTEITGARGLPGTTLYMQTGAPSPQLGQDGDGYIRTDGDLQFYGPKAGGIWPAPRPMRGEPGMDAIDLGGGISASQHAHLRQLQHIAAEGPFDADAVYHVDPGLFPAHSEWRTTDNKLIYTSDVVWDGVLVGSETQKTYDQSGAVLITCVDTMTYDGLAVASITRSIS